MYILIPFVVLKILFLLYKLIGVCVLVDEAGCVCA